jgi:hypothetical protein
MFPGNDFGDTLNSFKPVGLEEMENFKLMDRFDTKYVMPVSRIPDIMKSMDGGYRILEISEQRFFPYMTTYLDTDDYLFFNQHVTGRSERHKVRFRRYESSGITYLEVKRRTNKERTVKWRIENDLTPEKGCDDIGSDFIRNYIPGKALKLKPVLITNFKRITFTGSEFNERITLDYNITFTDMKENSISLPGISIIELKRDRFSNRSPMGDILKFYSVHPSGFSKYCIGSALLDNVSRKNVIKAKLLMVKRIEDEYVKSF